MKGQRRCCGLGCFRGGRNGAGRAGARRLVLRGWLCCNVCNGGGEAKVKRVYEGQVASGKGCGKAQGQAHLQVAAASGVAVRPEPHLPVVPVHVDAHHSAPKGRVGRLDQVVVDVLLGRVIRAVW